MIRLLSSLALIAALGFSLSACGEDKKENTQTQAPAKTVEKTAPAPAPTKTTEKSDREMTPGEALDNMQRDAGIVADKAKEGYNAAKEAVTKALSD